MSGPVLVMAGGTGGHVFPALAVAEALRARHVDVVWMGTRRGLEARVVPEAGIPMEWISIGGLRGKTLLSRLAGPFKLLFAVMQALAVMARLRPAAVLGMGGYAAGPGGIAAWLLRRPLVIHEQNAVAGVTNRVLSRFARRVFTPREIETCQARRRPALHFSVRFAAKEAVVKAGDQRAAALPDGGVPHRRLDG